MTQSNTQNNTQQPDLSVKLTEDEQVELGIRDLIKLRSLPKLPANNLGVTRMAAFFRNGRGKSEYRAEDSLRGSWELAKALGLDPKVYGSDDEEAFLNVLNLANTDVLKANGIPQAMVTAVMDRHLNFADVWTNVRRYVPQNDPTTTRLYVEAAEETGFVMDLVGMAYSKLMLAYHPEFVTSAEISVGCKIDS